MIDTVVLSLLIFFGSVCIGGMAWCFWGLYCNKVTHSQRLALLEVAGIRARRAIERRQDWQMAYAEFNAVSYEEHLHYLMTFRDPLKLYERAAARRQTVTA